MISSDLFTKWQLFMDYRGYSLNQLEQVTKISRRNLLRDIDRVNELLEEGKLEPIQLVEDHLQVPLVSQGEMIQRLPNLSKQIFFQTERPEMIVLMVLLKRDFVSAYHFQEFLHMSRNAVGLDVKAVKVLLEPFGLTLVYSRKEGYCLKGVKENIFRLTDHILKTILQQQIGRWEVHYISNYWKVDLQVDAIGECLTAAKVTFVPERLSECIYWLAIVNNLTEVWSDEEGIDIELFHMPLVQEVMRSFPNLKRYPNAVVKRLLAAIEGDPSWKSSGILNSKLPSNDALINVEGGRTKSERGKIQLVMEEIIDAVKGKTGVEFPQGQAFKDNLYRHLVPAYFRIKFKMQLANPLTEEIKANYGSLFRLVALSLEPLSRLTGEVISEDEIAYFTMHFGGYLTLDQPVNISKRAIVVCPNGISSSLMIAEQLKRIMPEIQVEQLLSTHDLAEADLEGIDLVFSPVQVTVRKPVFIAKPIMNAIEKDFLKKEVYHYFHIQPASSPQVDRLVEVIQRHASIKDPLALRKSLEDFFAQEEGRKRNKEKEGERLEALLEREKIQRVKSVSDWKEAVRLAAKPLLDSGDIEPSYVEAMIETVEEVGPYIVLVPHVAVPHAGADKGVNRLGISALLVEEAVDFNIKGEEEDKEDKQVQLIFVLATVDSQAHLKALQQLAVILDDEEFIDQLIQSANEDDFYRLITEKAKEME